MNKLLVIVGPTASGKSALGLKIAQKFNAEIINADSRSIYRYMDIGTAKPTSQEMLLIPHHLVNIKNPNQVYSASKFKRDALKAIDDIVSRGRLPIIVGGTGLYVDSLLFDYQFPGLNTDTNRKTLRELPHEELLQKLLDSDFEAFDSIDLKNPHRVLRAVETAGFPRSKSTDMRPDTLVIGLSLNKEVIQKRIYSRIKKMLREGLINEVEQVGETFGWDNESMTGPAYRSFKGVILSDKTIADASQEFAKRDIALAKRQMTWFKRNKNIHWLDAADSEQLEFEATVLIKQFMA